MVMICQEAMAGNHSLRRCKAPVCNWTCFVDCREWQLASANFGGNWYQNRVSGEVQAFYAKIVVGYYGWMPW